MPHVFTLRRFAAVLAIGVGAAGLRAGAEETGPTPDAAAERSQLIGSLPLTQPGAFEEQADAAGNFIYEATAAKPLVTGGAFELQADQIVKGLTVVRAWNVEGLCGIPYNNGLYWKLGNLPAGKYWLGVVYQSNEGDREGTAYIGGMLGSLYVNGRVVQYPFLSDPVQIAPGVWFAEAQAAEAEALKPGDEIALLARNGGYLLIARLVLRPQEPARGAHRQNLRLGPFYHFPETVLQLNVETAFVDGQGRPFGTSPADAFWAAEQWAPNPAALQHDGARAVARCRVANPLPVPLTVDYECVVKGYYGQEAGRDVARLTLAAHERVERLVAFETTPDDPGYSIRATVQAVKPPKFNWPEADTVALLPGLRQSVAWPDPFNYTNQRRVRFMEPVADTRPAWNLGGSWECALTTDREPPFPPPADLTFKPATVPGVWPWAELIKLKPRPHGIYARRTFVLPADATNRAWRVVIDSVIAEATAWVNGRKVGHVRGENAPLVADLTGAARPGTNELVVLVRDVLAVMNPAYTNLTDADLTPSVSHLDAAAGTSAKWGDLALGCGSMGAAFGVQLEGAPLVAAEDVLAVPSVRRQTLGARLTAVNRSARPVRAVARATVLDARRPVLDLGELPVTLAPGEARALAFDRRWANPRLWSPEDPHLYVLAVELRDADTGAALDLARARFGFRESWLAGDRILLNGRPVKLKGTTGGVILGYPPGAFQLSRGAWPADYFDEAGILASEFITGVYNSASAYNVESEAFWASARTNLLARAKRLWNHACIIAWDLSNEWYGFAMYTGADLPKAARQLESLTTEIRKHDPTRWTFYNGDGDLRGLHDNFSGHYLLESSRPNPVGGYGFNGHSSYFPDGAFWRPLDRDFAPGEKIKLSRDHDDWFVEWGRKVLMNTENLWKTGGYMPPGPGKFMGEDNVLSPAVDMGSGEGVWYWKQNVDAHRDLGMASVSIYPCYERRVYPLQEFILPDTLHHGFAGRRVSLRYSLHNDVLRPAAMAFAWRLLGPDGRALAQGRDARRMNSGVLRRGRIEFTLPAVAQRTACTLDLRLEADGRFVYGEQRAFDVFPDQPVPAGALTRQVLLYEPPAVAAHVPMRPGRMGTSGTTGATAAALKAAGVSFQALEKIEAPVSNAWKILVVIGENALTASNAAAVARLAEFVDAGGRVVILAQSVAPAGLPLDVKLEPRQWVSQPFVRTPTHPIFSAPSSISHSPFPISHSPFPISSWDLHFWQPDRVSARGAYAKPEGGPAVPLVDSGDDTGLEWVQLLELVRGQGLYLLCQLPLASAYDAEPMARELLARVLRYAGGDAAFLANKRTLTLLAPEGSAVARRLQDLRVAFRPAAPDAPWAPADPILLDAALKPTDAQQAQWARALKAGATLVVAGANPADAGWLAGLAGRPVRLAVPPYAMWRGRGYRTGSHALTAGLSQMDLYWKRYDGSETAAYQVEDASFCIEPLQDFAASAEGAAELVFPGALVELPVGQGRLVLDQRRWMTSNERLAGRADRNLKALVQGLGVRIDPVPIRRDLPPQVTYRIIDLTPLANRALADDAPDDGQGGWSDQGPTADLRTFPTGEIPIAGVPFKIGKDKTLIVLAGAGRPGNAMPKEVTIPVGFPAEGFFFLHSTAYSANDPVAVYQIQYAEGSTYDILLRREENIRDWAAAPAPLLREKETQSIVAWQGSCPMFSAIGVYRMLWVNPRPDAPVKAIRFSNPVGESVPILMGLTAAVRGTQTAGGAADAARAQALLAQAQTAVDGQRLDEAAGLLQQALAADPTLSAAHQALADLCERRGDEDAALAAYRAWAATKPPTPLPYNRIGEILEKRKDLKGALEAFTQSLKVEWNQPPTIQAKSRLEKLVAP